LRYNKNKNTDQQIGPKGIKPFWPIVLLVLVVALATGFICAYCSNGVCGKGENKCNCPVDCKSATTTNNNQANKNILDISESFKIAPMASYSIKEHSSLKGGPVCTGCVNNLKWMTVSIPCQNNFLRPLWKNTCTDMISLF